MKQVQWRVAAVATALSLMMAAGASAQYAGWTIPDTAKTEKGPAKNPADAAKKGKSLYTSNCAKCHGPEGKGNGPDSDHAADLTDLAAGAALAAGHVLADDKHRVVLGHGLVQRLVDGVAHGFLWHGDRSYAPAQLS